jgi:NAD+ kinase
MPEPLRRIAVATHLTDARTRGALAELVQLKAGHGLELLMGDDEAAKHPDEAALGYRRASDDELRDVDLALVFGGDGIVLRSLGRLMGSGVPTLGVNFGHVGFLAGLPLEGWQQALVPILEGAYRVADLLTVEVRINDESFAGVNDVVLSRVAPRHVLHLEYEVSGVMIGRMLCDGLIAASPSGSTAYNLSCDGPIVVWDANVLVLNFIAPHSLAFRPMVLRPDHEITVRNVSYAQEAEIVVDGASVGRMHAGDEVRICAGDRRARLMLRGEGSFYQNVEEKLFDRKDAR